MIDYIIAIPIILLGSWFVYGCERETRWSGLKKFETDDCSGGMSWIYRKLTGKRLPWADVCVEHDRAYHKGGTRTDRLEADRWLLAGVAIEGYAWWAWAMFVAVRLGGVRWLPTKYRWGYGEPYKMPWNGQTDN